jgi:hypothetical protein
MKDPKVVIVLMWASLCCGVPGLIVGIAMNKPWTGIFIVVVASSFFAGGLFLDEKISEKLKKQKEADEKTKAIEELVEYNRRKDDPKK